MSKGKRVTVADYLEQQINICGKAQNLIAEEVGYAKPNVITMFKQGKTKLPINKVPAFAKSLGVDPIHLLRLVMSEYMPETWDVIEKLVGNALISESEMVILDVVRQIGGGQDCAPQTEEDTAQLAELAQKWRDRSESLAKASAERVARDKKAR